MPRLQRIRLAPDGGRDRALERLLVTTQLELSFDEGASVTSTDARWRIRPAKISIGGLAVARSAAHPVSSVCRHGYMIWAKN